MRHPSRSKYNSVTSLKHCLSNQPSPRPGRGTRHAPAVAHCHAGLGTLYTTTGHWEQARTELSAAITLYRAMAMTFWLPQTEATLARCCEASGEGPGAVLSSSDSVRKMV